MKTIWGVALCSSLALACGGGGSNTKGASVPAASSTGDSQIAMAFPAGDDGSPAGKVDLSGLAFSQYDPDAKALLIYVLDPATQPAPSCDNVGLAAMMKQKSGTVAAIVIKDFEGKATKLKAGLGLFAQGDTSKLETAPSAPLDATTVDITTYDAKTIDATITTDGTAKATVSGKIHGTVCPNTSMQKQAQQVQDDQMAKMQAAGGGAPQPAGGETVTMSTMLEVVTPASTHTLGVINAMVKLDPKQKALLIVVPPPDVKPSCDHFAVPAKGDSGRTFFAIGAKNIPSHRPGEFAVSTLQITTFGGGKREVENVALEGTTIGIHQFEDKLFMASFEGAPDATAKLNGPIGAIVCPDGHVDLPPGDKAASPAKSGKKKK